MREKAVSADLRLSDRAIIDRFQIAPTEPAMALRHEGSGRQLVFELTSPAPWYAVTTWTQAPESDFYCIEPWLGLPNAIHHGEGLRRLSPGATEVATVVLDASGW